MIALGGVTPAWRRGGQIMLVRQGIRIGFVERLDPLWIWPPRVRDLVGELLGRP